MGKKEINIPTRGEGFYEITEDISRVLQELNQNPKAIIIQTPHTSCALCINESYDPSAKEDMENFLKKLAPRNMAFIKHTLEGEDDSPSHMKSILLNPSLSIIVENNELQLGTWQGIFLCEFRDRKQNRKLWIQTIN